MKNHFLFISFFLVLCSRSIVAQYNTPVLEGTHNNAYTTVEPPSIYKYRTVLGKTATSNFEISYTDTMPPLQARLAIEYAINIWEFLINSNQTIKILVRWKDLGYSSTGSYPLANCGATTYYNSPSLPEENVQYPIALAEHLLNQNLNGTDFDMIVTINSNDSISWYFGTDGVPQENKPDMVSVILHEVAHGLGYIGFFNVGGDYGYKGISGFPVDTNSHSSIYDTYAALGSYYPALDFLVNYPNHSTELKTRLTSNNVYFSGDNAWIQNGRYILPKLYAPSGWKAGSSIFHLDDATFPQGNSNSLMTHQLDQAEVIHSPGEVGLALLQDLGWSINRLATFIHPEPGVALQKGVVDTIKWTDNEGGSYNLVLLDSIDNFIMTVCTLGTADEGLNQYVWTVPANVPNGKYRIKVSFGGAFGITNLFTISDQQQVAAPVFTPPPGTYEDPVTVTASCSTPGATIRYTTNGTEPNINSPVFPPSLVITTLTTIKAKAFKTGMIPSLTTTAVYNIGIEITVPEITPMSGTYPQGLRTTISWQQGLRCFMNWTDDGSEPYDPSIPGHQWELTWNPTYNLWPDIRIIKMKARTYLNGSWSSLVEREYIVIRGVNIKQLDASGTSFGQAAYWNQSFWNYVDPEEAVAMENNKNYFLSSQDWKPSTYQKFNYWDDNLNNKRFRNWDTLTVKSDTREVRSHFAETVSGVTIKNNLESTGINGGSIEFMDPWLVDFNEPPYGLRSRGMDAPFFPKTSPFNPNYSSSHKGVFLNQPTISGKPYYKVGMPTEQTISVNGQSRKFFPYKWSGIGVTFQDEYARQTGVVFSTTNATATAVLKGQLMSGDQNGISSASQRKIVRTDNGRYHVVYESMGTVWYAHSATSDFFGAWYPDQLMLEKGKNPAIEYDGNVVKVVCEKYDPQYGGDADIWLLSFTLEANGRYENTEADVIASYPNSYYGNAKPVISYTTNEIFIAYRINATGGIKYKARFYNFGNWSDWTTEDDITGTNSYSINPSVIGEPGYMHIAYESLNGIYYKFGYRQGYNSWQFLLSQHISSRSGFNYNNYPAISLSLNSVANKYVMVSWRGVYDSHQSPLPKETGGSEPLRRQEAVVAVGWGSSWGTTSNFGSNVDFTNNGSLNTAYGSIMTWSESNGEFSKYVRRRTPFGYDAITSLSDDGIQTLVSNGSEFGNIKAMVFDNSTNAPYLLNRCANDFTYIPDGFGKISEAGIIDISYGRSGIIEKNGIEFVFNIGDVLLNGETIKFIERADTLAVTSIEDLNFSVRTDTLNLNAQSELIFSDYYYVVNGNWADSLLSNDFNVNFKCELVKLSTGEAIGVFEEVSYNKTNLDEYGHQGYLVDCSGIEAGDYYLRLTAAVNEEVGLSLSDIQMDNVVLNKANLSIRNFKGENIPVEYSLEQNYPNPFNPTTTIRYQLPKDGKVTLKVYDILGAEVATLVNEEKAAGKCEVNFNASSLASGVYIYRLNVNDYVNVKKMVLLK